MTYLDTTKKAAGRVLLLLFVVLLAACNSTESGLAADTEDNNDTADEGSGAEPADEENTDEDNAAPVVLDIGTKQLGDFNSGAILIGKGSGTDLSPNGEVDVEVRLVDTNDGNRLVVGTEYTVQFESICSGREPAAAEFKPAEISVTNGIARTRYIDRGCGNVRGGDPDSLFAVVIGESVGANASLNVLPTSVGRIEVESISATDISYREGVVIGGQALPLQSQITYRVVSAQGDPIPNREVSFEPSSDVGGIEVRPSEGLTDDFGTVRTFLYSGRVNSSVAVIATHTTDDDVKFSTSSKAIAMHTGYPTQKGFNIQANVYNPNAWRYSNVPVEIDATLSDRFGNFGPETEIVFSSKRGGRIAGSCTTADQGECSVPWLSEPGSADSPLIYVTALTEGEGDFKDLNGDGLFDPSDDGNSDFGIADTATGCNLSQEEVADGFCSYPEAHFETVGLAPDEEYYSFNRGIEEFSDWNNSGDWNDRPGKYQGVRCTDAAKNDGHCAETLQLRQYVGIVLASDGVPTFNNNEYGAFTLGDSNENTLPIDTTVSGTCREGTFEEETWVSPVPNQFKTDLTGYTYSTIPTEEGNLSGCEVAIDIDDMSYRISVVNLGMKVEPVFENPAPGEFSLKDKDDNAIRPGSTVVGECEVGDFVRDAWESPVFSTTAMGYEYTTAPNEDEEAAEDCSVRVLVSGVAFDYSVRPNPPEEL